MWHSSSRQGNKQRRKWLLCCGQTGPVLSQFSGYLLSPQILFIYIKKTFWGLHISQEHKKSGIWQWVHQIKHGPEMLHYYCPWPSSSFQFSCSSDPFSSPACCVSHLHLGSFWTPPGPSPRFLNFIISHILPKTSLRLLLSSPCLDNTRMSDWTLVVLFSIFQLREFSIVIQPLRQESWLKACYACYVVWGSTALASPGSLLGIQTQTSLQACWIWICLSEL